ncbi:MAG: hypothetical protein Aurels2KO_39160 [Aureliella sp.]
MAPSIPTERSVFKAQFQPQLQHTHLPYQHVQCTLRQRTKAITSEGRVKLAINPYQPPTDIDAVDCRPTSEAKRRLAKPATALIIMASIHSVFVSISVVVIVVSWVGNDGGIGELIAAVIGCAQFIALVLIAIGAAKMGHLESLTLARVGATLACIPVITPFFLVGIPFGIWALRLLAEPAIKSAFDASTSANR